MRLKRKYQKTNQTRPKKSPGAKRRRQMEHRKRLVELGMDQAAVDALNSRQVLTLLQRPLKVVEACAAAAEE